MEGDREKCIQAGMNGYITKPIQPDRLIETLNRLLWQPDRAPAGKHRFHGA
jgi:CheY-like chemotaxis protein